MISRGEAKYAPLAELNNIARHAVRLVREYDPARQFVVVYEDTAADVVEPSIAPAGLLALDRAFEACHRCTASIVSSLGGDRGPRKVALA